MDEGRHVDIKGTPRPANAAIDALSERASADRKLSRREILGAGGALLLGGGIAAGLRRWRLHERGMRAQVVIAKAASYETDLATLILEGMNTLGVTRREIRGRTILLKPNLVETAIGQAHINTNPAVVVATAEAFRRLDAQQVIVGEGQGHRRDSRLVLEESGMGRALLEAGLPFVDLNHDEPVAAENLGNQTSLAPLYLPRTLRDADWVVSIPKLKTHHWAGVTCAMKNLFGAMPGMVYGWPKNILHYEGIDQSIVDINATVQPSFAIVDGIVGMEGDGPILGTPKSAGCLLLGRNLPAVDATAVRVMGLNPYGIRYLAAASGQLGPIHARNIAQRGEPIETMKQRFFLPDWSHMQGVKTG